MGCLLDPWPRNALTCLPPFLTVARGGLGPNPMGHAAKRLTGFSVMSRMTRSLSQIPVDLLEDTGQIVPVLPLRVARLDFLHIRNPPDAVPDAVGLAL